MTTTLPPDELDQLLKAGGVLLLDVRRKTDRDADPAGIPGAEWRDPEAASDWRENLPRDRPVVVYCVRGGSVSRSVTAALSEAGVRTGYLEGGIEAWKASGRATG
ncbi:MAG: thiosulfate sulfurtransferase GlpE [Desulfobacterales bacterium]|jgi:rhodanese-related sulfurtransferase|nr:thiosulfate sulfurtransferase GlpE [Desulfobacterales bacterium]